MYTCFAVDIIIYQFIILHDAQSRMQNIICICDTVCTFGYELNVLRFIYNTGRIASLEHGLLFVACMMITNVTVKRGYKKQENLDLIQKVS